MSTKSAITEKPDRTPLNVVRKLPQCAQVLSSSPTVLAKNDDVHTVNIKSCQRQKDMSTKKLNGQLHDL